MTSRSIKAAVRRVHQNPEPARSRAKYFMKKLKERDLSPEERARYEEWVEDAKKEIARIEEERKIWPPPWW
jgi:ferric-dicitrate binding protein FerR (iron transport regulator)